MQRRPERIHLLIPLLAMVALACGPCSLLSGQKPTPPHPIAISTESAAQLESRIRENLGGESGEQFILRMTDAEVTSLVATKLSEYSDSPVVDPQVWFTKGKIYGSGCLVNVLPVETEFYVVASAHVVDGKAAVEIEDVSAGALPLPAGALEMISQSINETVEELQLDVEVTALEILEGEAIVQGIRK